MGWGVRQADMSTIYALDIRLCRAPFQVQVLPSCTVTRSARSSLDDGRLERSDQAGLEEVGQGLLEDVDGASCTGRSRRMYIDEGYIHVQKRYKETCKASVSIDWSSIRPLRSD